MLFVSIDARRRTEGKRCLLPLKKSERKTIIYPGSLKMMAREKREVILASVAILIRVFMSVLIVYIDYLLTWILDVIYRNSRIEYHQTGR